VIPFEHFGTNCRSGRASVKLSGDVAGPALRRSRCAAGDPVERDGAPAGPALRT
jgi:hypothetical protein